MDSQTTNSLFSALLLNPNHNGKIKPQFPRHKQDSRGTRGKPVECNQYYPKAIDLRIFRNLSRMFSKFFIATVN